jgi:hypothetical protein
LLYAWHHQKTSSDRPWGNVAPIYLDTLSKPERLRAYQTIKAYCASYSLHLVALINLPPAPKYYDHPGTSSRTIYADQTSRKCLPLILAKDEMLQEIVASEVTEVVLVAKDYLKMVRKSSGRVVVVSGCLDSASIRGFHSYSSLIPIWPLTLIWPRSGC